MRKLLLLGSSLGVMEIVQRARQRGWYTIVTDNRPLEESPVKQAADESWMISTSDTDRLKEMCLQEGIGAVFSGVSEFNLDRVRILTQDLGLPCYIDEDTWKLARNKGLFKRMCEKKGIPVVQEFPIPDSDDDASWEQIVYPVVVKPVDGTGNLGLSICRNRAELEDGIRNAKAVTTNPQLIIERYIVGEETWNYYVCAEGVVRYVYSGRVFRQPGYPTFLYSFGTSAVKGVDEYLAQMNSQCIELLREVGCREGVAWIQCIRDQEGNYYALEMAHRLSADVAGGILQKSIGFNNVEWMLDTALGVHHTPDMLPQQVTPPYKMATCIYYLFADHSGQIDRIVGLDKLDSRFQVEIVRKPGDTVSQYNLMVKIVFPASHVEEMCQVLQYLNQSIDIRDTINTNLIIRFTDYNAVRQEHRGLMRG